MPDQPTATAASDVPDLGKPFCTRCHKWGHRYTECSEPATAAHRWMRLVYVVTMVAGAVAIVCGVIEIVH